MAINTELEAKWLDLVKFCKENLSEEEIVDLATSLLNDTGAGRGALRVRKEILHGDEYVILTGVEIKD